MSKSGKNANRLKRLDDVLAIYGANISRWPAGERNTLERFIRSDKRAREIYAEASALDTLMSHAPRGQVTRSLRDRIVAAAVSDPEHEARVVPLDDASSHKPAAPDGAFWPAAAALAASFALGIYLGLGELGTGAYNQALDLAAYEQVQDESDPAEFWPEGMVQDSEGLL